jgi:hypothetical protein
MLDIEYVWDPLNVFVVFGTRSVLPRLACIVWNSKDVWVNKAFVDGTWLVL